MANKLDVTQKIKAYDLRYSKGGTYLRHARQWIQENTFNGDRVTWGSQEFLNFKTGITVHDLEMFAAEIAAHAQNALLDQIKHYGIVDGEKL